MVAGVNVDTLELHSNPRKALSIPLHSTHSQSEESEPSHAGTPAREADVFVDCDSYREHQSSHYRSTTGFRCRICSPEDPA